MSRTVLEWQKASYDLAAEKGWHENSDPLSVTRIGSRIALIHAEISEALECVRQGQMGLIWVGATAMPFEHDSDASDEQRIELGWKPEGFAIELADVFLRWADFSYTIGAKVQYDFSKPPSFTPITEPEVVGYKIAQLHEAAAGLWNAANHYAFVHRLHQLALATGVDLMAAVETKHLYNKTRSQRHGGKVL